MRACVLAQVRSVCGQGDCTLFPVGFPGGCLGRRGVVWVLVCVFRRLILGFLTKKAIETIIKQKKLDGVLGSANLSVKQKNKCTRYNGKKRPSGKRRLTKSKQAVRRA